LLEEEGQVQYYCDAAEEDCCHFNRSESGAGEEL
jgi:hypothetical protein